MYTGYIKKLKKKYLTIEELKNLDDNDYVDFNTNILYYLLSLLNLPNINQNYEQCLEILIDFMNDMEILEHFGIRAKNSFYFWLKVSDAKKLIEFMTNKKLYIPITTLKYCKENPPDIKRLRKDYNKELKNK